VAKSFKQQLHEPQMSAVAGCSVLRGGELRCVYGLLVIAQVFAAPIADACVVGCQ
jgi:hypothetical protein